MQNGISEMIALRRQLEQERLRTEQLRTRNRSLLSTLTALRRKLATTAQRP